MKRKRKEPLPRRDNVKKYWNHKTKEWSDKLWSVNYKNINNNKKELYPRQWFDICQLKINRRHDTMHLRLITCNVTESLDKTIINSIIKIILQRSEANFVSVKSETQTIH